MKLTKYNQLKHGMRVRCKIYEEEIKYAKLSRDKRGSVYICQNIQGGHPAENKLGYKFSYHLCNHDRDKEDWDDYVEDLQSHKKGLRDMEIGDILIIGDGAEVKVMDVREEIFFISERGDFDRPDSYYYGFKEVEKKGWKLKGAEEEDEIVEFEGKKYNRAEFDKRLEKFKPVKE